MTTDDFFNCDPVVFVVSRKDVEACDTASIIDALKSCLISLDRARTLFEKIDIVFHGYDHDARELFEIPEVRNFVTQLDQKFPYWLFFMTKKSPGLHFIMLCFMPPYLTDTARETVLPQRLDELLSKRWFPAMNQLCEKVGFSEEKIEQLSDRVAEYFISGPH